MHKKDVNEELFDRVYHNQASNEEMEQFKLRLKESESYRKTFQQYLKINEGILQDSRNRFKEKFKEKVGLEVPANSPLNTLVPKKKYPRIRQLNPLLIAASFLILISLSFFSYNRFYYWESIHEKYAFIIDDAHLLGPEENGLVQADQVQKNEAQMEKGFQYLKEEEFQLAINAFETVLPISTKEYDDYFTAQYNMALAQLKLKKIPEAQAILTQLSKRPEKHYLKAKAEQLLQDLRKPKFLFF